MKLALATLSILPIAIVYIFASRRFTRSIASTGASEEPSTPSLPAGGGGVDAAASERVDAAPPAGDVEHLEPTDGLRECGVDDEVIADRLQAEHRGEEQKGAPVDHACGLQAVGY